jgi:uncharacterized phage-associated protein
MAVASYNPRKAAQVIAYMAIKGNNAVLPVLKAVKLVYLADRESLCRYGFPILEEALVSMPQGPVNSATYSHINGEEDLDACGWSKFLQAREGNNVSVVPGIVTEDLDELSDADIICLDSVWSKFGEMNKWEIWDWTHDPKNIPEWEDPNGSSRPIPLERVLRYLNIKNPDDRAELIKEYRQIDQLFSQMMP